MECCILCKNGRRIYVGGVVDVSLKDKVLKVEFENRNSYFNFDNILAYGSRQDIDNFVISDKRL